METRLPSGIPNASASAPRVETAPVRSAVKTDLAPPVAVSAQAGAEQTRWTRDQRKLEAPGSFKRNESSIETDRETGDLIYKVVDPETRATVAQYPYESLLKLRAYIKHADEAGN
jgi:hypothetical protein